MTAPIILPTVNESQHPSHTHTQFVGREISCRRRMTDSIYDDYDDDDDDLIRDVVQFLREEGEGDEDGSGEEEEEGDAPIDDMECINPLNGSTTDCQLILNPDTYDDPRVIADILNGRLNRDRARLVRRGIVSADTPFPINCTSLYFHKSSFVRDTGEYERFIHMLDALEPGTLDKVTALGFNAPELVGQSINVIPRFRNLRRLHLGDMLVWGQENLDAALAHLVDTLEEFSFESVGSSLDDEDDDDAEEMQLADEQLGTVLRTLSRFTRLKKVILGSISHTPDWHVFYGAETFAGLVELVENSRSIRSLDISGVPGLTADVLVAIANASRTKQALSSLIYDVDEFDANTREYVDGIIRSNQRAVGSSTMWNVLMRSEKDGRVLDRLKGNDLAIQHISQYISGALVPDPTKANRRQ